MLTRQFCRIRFTFCQNIHSKKQGNSSGPEKAVILHAPCQPQRPENRTRTGHSAEVRKRELKTISLRLYPKFRSDPLPELQLTGKEFTRSIGGPRLNLESQLRRHFTDLFIRHGLGNIVA